MTALPIESTVPWWLVASLRNRFYLENFVETGTHNGATAALAAAMFPQVYTIEIAPAISERARLSCGGRPNVELLVGDSAAVLAGLLPKLSAPCLFYLDAHWSGGEFKPARECPLLDELAVLGERKSDVILIDDARMFATPPRPPHDPAQWPTLDAVVAALQVKAFRWVTLLADVLIATPEPLTRTF